MTATLMSNNLTPSLLMVEQGSTPATPSAGDQKLFIRTSDHLLCYVNSSGTVTAVAAGASGSITSSGYTQTTARLLGRTTASTGAIEEITVGSGLSLSAGSLTATGALTIVRGQVTDTGSIAQGSGFTVSRASTGAYDLTWSPAFASNPAVVAIADSAVAYAILSGSSTTTTQVQMRTDAGANVNSYFWFIAIGV